MKFRTAIVMAGVLSALALSPALADKQGDSVRKQLASGKGTAIPTGIDVPGCAEYVLDGSGVRQMCDKNLSKERNAKFFWEERDRRSSGSDGGASQ